MQEVYKVRPYKDDSVWRSKMFGFGMIIGILVLFVINKITPLDELIILICLFSIFSAFYFLTFYRPFHDQMDVTADSVLIKKIKSGDIHSILFTDLQKTEVVVITEKTASERSLGLTTARVILKFFTHQEVFSYELSWKSVEKINEEFIQYGLKPIEGMNSKVNKFEKNSANVEIWSIAASLLIGLLVVFAVALYVYIKYS